MYTVPPNAYRLILSNIQSGRYNPAPSQFPDTFSLLIAQQVFFHQFLSDLLTNYNFEYNIGDEIIKQVQNYRDCGFSGMLRFCEGFARLLEKMSEGAHKTVQVSSTLTN